MIVCKVNDFAFLRCDFEFEFKVNVNKYAIGALIVNHEPVPTLSGTTPQMNNLTQISQYPKTIIDVASGTTYTHKVPFVYKNVAWDMINELTIPWAELNIWVLNTLNSTSGSVAATMTVWLKATNIELSVPVPNTITPFIPAVYKGDKRISKLREDFLERGQKSLTPDEMKRLKMFHSQLFAHSEGTAIAQSNSVSSTVKAVGNIAGGVAQMGLGPVSEAAAAVDWLAPIAANALEIFGFSKPDDREPVHSMVQVPAKNFTSHNGTDNSVVLGFDVKNNLAVDNSFFRTSADEMDINYVASNPNFLETFAWPTTAIAGQILAQYPVSPGMCADLSTSTVQPTHMAYVTAMHRYWRGSINYQFQVVANAFYSGRLGLAFFPRRWNITGPLDVSIIDAAPQKVVDVRNTATFALNVPWTNPSPFLLTNVGSRTGAGQLALSLLANQNRSVGTVVVYVYAPLKCPEVVPQELYVNCWLSGGPDLAFAINDCPTYVPVPYEAPAGVKKIKKIPKAKKLIAHMDNPPSNLNVAPGTAPQSQLATVAPPKIRDTMAQKFSTGERNLNLRQYCRQFSFVADTAIANGQELVLDPCWFGFTDDSVYLSRTDRISRMYAFYKGSMRYKIIPRIPDGVDFPVFSVFTDLDGTAIPVEPSSVGKVVDAVGFSHFINVAQTPFIEIRDPWYSRHYLAVVTDRTASNRQNVYVSPEYVGADTEVIVLAATGDDFTFGYLKSVPPLKVLP